MNYRNSYHEQHAKEVVPGLMLGGIMDLPFILKWRPDVLVPLSHVPGSIWDDGFRGEIVYYPIEDFSVLPEDVLERLVDDVTKRLKAGKKVALFCVGGHGRTGYVAACVLSRLGEKDPVGFLRKNYSESAVESCSQEREVRRFCK